MNLRDYQSKAAAACVEKWDKHDRILVSMPCGSGKTITGATLVHLWRELAEGFGRPNRVLWLAHRDELIWQAVNAIEAATGENVAIEKGSMRARGSAEMFDRRIVVSSVQSLFQEDRLNAFGRGEFGLLTVDEAHHFVAPGFREILEYFREAKVLGLTATTDRADGVSLGQIFDASYHYDILDAMRDGWLCRLRQEYVEVEGLDWSSVRKSGSGDLSAKDLDRIINEEAVLHKIVAPVVELAGDRPTIIFTPSVASARATAAIIPRYSNRGAAFVCGETPEEERRQIVQAYKDSHYGFLVNCMCLTEGFDAPATSCIVIARPSNSRMLVSQMIGRGLRGGPNQPIPGKSDCLVIDLVGSTLKHQLCTAAGMLTGDYDQVVTEGAERMILERSKEDEAPDVLDAVLEAIASEEELRREQRRSIMATAKMKRTAVDPFAVLDVPSTHAGPAFWESEFPDQSQLDRLEKAGIKPEGITKLEASRLLAELRRRRNDELCTYKQAKQLRAHGFDPSMTMSQAGYLMSWFGSRPGGWMQLQDHKRRNYAKKRGYLVEYAEIASAPAWCVGPNVECFVKRPGGEWKSHRTTKRTYSNQAVADGDDVIITNKSGWELRVPAEDAERLK